MAKFKYQYCGKLICGIKQLEILVGDRIANFGSFCRIGFKNSAEHSLVEAKAFSAQWHTYPLPCRLSLAGLIRNSVKLVQETIIIL